MSECPECGIDCEKQIDDLKTMVAALTKEAGHVGELYAEVNSELKHVKFDLQRHKDALEKARVALSQLWINERDAILTTINEVLGEK